MVVALPEKQAIFARELVIAARSPFERPSVGVMSVSGRCGFVAPC
jgi:hypothetical protein